jgi:glutamyl-tRNA synthetase
MPGHYPGTCRELTAAQRADREAQGRPPALRLRAGGARVAFEDRVMGQYEGVVDDVVVRRNDGTAAYNLAVVVDDADQRVGEVVRGADLIGATPAQMFVADALGLPRCSYAHVPLVLAADGNRLAKRGHTRSGSGAVTLADRRALGESAADVRARLLESAGLPADLGEALTTFDPAALAREATRWSEEAVLR